MKAFNFGRMFAQMFSAGLVSGTSSNGAKTAGSLMDALIVKADMDMTSGAYSTENGPGTQRAIARGNAKRKANQAIPTIKREDSRQVMRALGRVILKDERSKRKMDAMRSKQWGGAAAVA